MGVVPGAVFVVVGQFAVESATVVPIVCAPDPLIPTEPTGATPTPGTLRAVSSPFPVTGPTFDGERAGRRALAVRIIGETGARAADRPFADRLHPPSRIPVIDLGLDRIPKDVVRRGMGRISRLVVNRAGGLLLRMRRGSPDRVAQIHRLDHEEFDRLHPRGGPTPATGTEAT